MTEFPRWAKQAAVTVPTYPSPKTLIDFVMDFQYHFAQCAYRLSYRRR
jgi:hypothetical protein